jgi:hypothetical protein
VQPRRAAHKGRPSTESEMFVYYMVAPLNDRTLIPIRVSREKIEVQVPDEEHVGRSPMVVLDEKTQRLAVEWTRMVVKAMSKR